MIKVKLSDGEVLNGVVVHLVSDRGKGAKSPRRVAVSFKKFSLTKQSEAAACDINRIMARYERTGMIDHTRSDISRVSFGDVSGVVDYHTACNQVIDAQDKFMSLPSKIRNRFNNDPGALLAFCADAKNMDEAVLLGLVDPPVVPPPVVPQAGGGENKSV